jgi:integrase
MSNANQSAGSVRQLPSGKWQATVRLGEGRGAARTTKTFPTRREASAWLSNTKAAGVPTGPAASQTVAQAFDAYLAAKVLAVNTAETYRQARVHAEASGLGATTLAKLRPSALDGFTAYLVRQGLAPGTVNIYAKKLAAVLRFAHADGGLAFTPSAVTVTERPVEVPALTAAEVASLYEAAPDEFAPVIALGAFAGLRASEARAVTVADVDFLTGVVTVDKAVDERGEFVPTKTARSMRKVPLAPEVLTLLARACEGKARDDTIATNADGGVLSTSAFYRTFGEVARSAGVEVTSHALRKFYATTLLAHGVNPKAVAQYLGDSVATMLKTYALVQHTDAELARAATAAAFAAVAAA